MDLRSLSLGERIAAASGAAFFLFMFLSWLEVLSAWELFAIVDVLLALLALAAIALPLAKAAGAEPPIRPTNKTLLTRIAVVVLTVTVAFFLEGADRGVGIFLGLLAAAGMLYGAITMPGEEAPSRRGGRARRPRADRDFEEPPPGVQSWRESGLGESQDQPVAERETPGTETQPPRSREVPPPSDR